MRTVRAKYLLPIIAVLALGLCLTFTACDTQDGINFIYDRADEYVVADRASTAAQITALEVDWVNGAVVVEKGEPETEIEFYEVTEGDAVTYDTTMRYLLDGLTLKIKYAKAGRVPTGKLKKYLYIRIPADLQLQEIDVESVGANITVREMVANEVECSSVTGAIHVKCNASEVDVKNVSGDIFVESTAYSVDVENVSGVSTVVCRATPRYLDIETRSGDVYLRLAGDIGFTLEYETFNGLFFNAFTEKTVKQGKNYVYMNGGCEYSVESISGDLTIEKLLD